MHWLSSTGAYLKLEIFSAGLIEGGNYLKKLYFSHDNIVFLLRVIQKKKSMTILN